MFKLFAWRRTHGGYQLWLLLLDDIFSLNCIKGGLQISISNRLTEFTNKILIKYF